jgi:hypothetical protein
MDARETFRAYAENDRPIYDGIQATARVLAGNLRAAIAQYNRDAAGEIGGDPRIETDADKRAAISVFVAEVEELLTWELIGQYNAR